MQILSSEAQLLACYQRLEKPLFNVLYRMLWHRQDCQDLLQEAFVQVWQQRQQLRLEGLDAYIYTTALNLARQKLRWRLHWLFDSLEPWLESLYSEQDPEVQTQNEQQQRLLRQALARLTDKDREVLLLTEYSELTLAETATVLKIAAGTVASRRHRALQQLQHFLREDHDAN